MRLKIICPFCGREMIGFIEKRGLADIILFCSSECSANYYSSERKEAEKQAITNRFEIMDL